MLLESVHVCRLAHDFRWVSAPIDQTQFFCQRVFLVESVIPEKHRNVRALENDMGEVKCLAKLASDCWVAMLQPPMFSHSLKQKCWISTNATWLNTGHFLQVQSKKH